MTRAKKAAPVATPGDFTPDALALRTTDAKGRAYGGYQWPVEVGAIVECPDWNPVAKCGNGFHGYLDGLGSRDQCSDSADALWWIVEVVRAECVLIDGDKSKFPRCRVTYVGSFGGALARLPLEMVKGIFVQTEAVNSAAATTGVSSAAATTGDSSAAHTSGPSSIAAALGPYSSARADHASSAITISYWDTDAYPMQLKLVRSFMIGEHGVEAGKRYRLNAAGEPVEVTA